MRGESVQAALTSNQPHKLRKTLNLFNEAYSTGGVVRPAKSKREGWWQCVGVCATSVFGS